MNNIFLDQLLKNESFILGFGFLLIMLFVSTLLKGTKRKRRNFDSVKFSNSKFTEYSLSPSSKLEVISKSNFSPKTLMNKSEYKLFNKLTMLLEKSHKHQKYRLFTQVAMGEFIASTDASAFRLINGKRVDFLIIDMFGMPVIVIEYQGGGHYQNDAIERDAIKKEACRKANIEYVEFPKEYDELHFQRISHILNNKSSKSLEN